MSAMQTRSKTSSGVDKSDPKPEFKRISMEQLEQEMGAVDPYDENEDESFSSLSSSTESGTDYDSVSTEDMSEEEEIQPEPRVTVKRKMIVRRGWQKTAEIEKASLNLPEGKRLTRSATEKVKKEEVVIDEKHGIMKEEPFKKVDPSQFEAAMATVDPYNEEEDEDFDMEDSDEESQSGSDYDSVNTEDMSEEEIVEEEAL